MEEQTTRQVEGEMSLRSWRVCERVGLGGVAGVMERKDVKEQQLWSYLVQLASAVRVVHGAGLVFHGSITPSKLLVTPNGRLRCGTLSRSPSLKI